MNFSKYINLSYRNLGRDFDGVDCWGLIWIVFKNVRNILLPDFTDLQYSKDWYLTKDHIIDSIDDTWMEIDPPYNIYDVIIFYSKNSKVANHIGMMISDDKYIHISEKYSSRVDTLNEYWTSRIYKGMRYIGQSHI